MTLKQMAALALNLMIPAAAALPARADEAAPSANQVKAAFVYNFAKFVDWPPQEFSSATTPIVIGLWGNDPFNHDLENAVKNKRVDTHPLSVRYLKSLDELKTCQIVFISASETRRWPEILRAVDSASVLTITENSDRFLAAGGMINLFRDEDKFRFEINDTAARRSGLKLSSRLLQLASKKSQA